MRTLELKDGDLVIRGGGLSMVEGDKELEQSVQIEMQTARGEWFLNPLMGMDREPLLGKRLNEEEARAAILEAATADPRIETVENITFTRDGRNLLVTLELTKTDGESLLLEEVEV